MPQYLCQRCSHYLATTHMTIVTAGVPSEYHICAPCHQAEEGTVAKKCPSCGITLAEIKKRGRFGCGLDYTVFFEDVLPLIADYHGASQHVGKNPGGNLFSA